MPDTASSAFREDLSAVTKDVKQSLDQERRLKQESSEHGEQQKEEELRAVREALTKLTGHEPTTALPPPVSREGVAETDPLADVDEPYREKITDLLDETYTGGGILKAANRALKENDPFLADLYHDTVTRDLHRRLTDENIL